MTTPHPFAALLRKLDVETFPAAPEVAALVEAVWQIKAHNYPPDESGHYGELGSIDGDMLFAALDALRVVATQAKEAK